MTAQIYKLRDYQNPKDLERMQRELEKEAAKILTPFVETESFGGTHPLVPYVETVGFTSPEMTPHDRALMESYRSGIPYGGAGIDGMKLDQEPA